MNGGTALVAEVDPARIGKRLATRYLDERVDVLDAAIDRALGAAAAGEAVSIGVLANAVDLLTRLLARGIVPDILTDQTSAHDELNGYVPHGIPFEEALGLRRADPGEYKRRAYASMKAHVEAMLELKARGAVTFDYGNNLRAQARKAERAARSRSKGSSRGTSGRSSAKGRGRSAGRRSAATRTTSPRPTRRSSSSSPETRRSPAGSASPASAWRTRASRPASAGSVTASGRRRGSPSTSSSGAAA